MSVLVTLRLTVVGYRLLDSNLNLGFCVCLRSCPIKTPNWTMCLFPAYL